MWTNIRSLPVLRRRSMRRKREKKNKRERNRRTLSTKYTIRRSGVNGSMYREKRFMCVRLNFEGKEGRKTYEREKNGENVCWSAAERTIYVFLCICYASYVYTCVCFVHTIFLPGGLLPMSDDGERRLFSSLFLSSARSSLTQISLSTPTTSARFVVVWEEKKKEEEEFQNEEKGKEKKDMKKRWTSFIYIYICISIGMHFI